MELAALGQQLLFGLSNGMIYVVFAVGLTLILGVMGTINVAHGEFYMLGVLIFCSLVTWFGINYLLALFLTIAFVGILGIIVSRLAIEPLLDKPNPLLSTLLSTCAVSIVFINGALLIWGAWTIPLKFPLEGVAQLGPMSLSWARIIIAFAGAAVLILFYLFLLRTKMGKSIRAISQSRMGARLVGIDPRREYALTFGIGSALAALAGVLIAPVLLGNPYVGQSMLLKGFVVVIVGGLGSVKGAILVGLLLGIAESLFGYYFSVFYREAFAYAIMIIMLLVRPRGIFYT